MKKTNICVLYRLITVTISMCIATLCFAQQIDVPLKLVFADENSRYYASNMNPTKKIEDLSGFKNIPAKPDLKAIYSVTAYSDGTHKSVFYVYVGLDKARGQKCMIVDSDGDRDFGNERKYTFKLDVYDNPTDLREIMNMSVFIPISVRIGEGVYKDTYVQIQPYSSYDDHQDKDEQMLDFLPLTAYFYRDTVKINGADVMVTASNSRRPIVPEDRLLPGTTFTFIENQQRFNKDYSIGDTLVVAGKKLHLLNLEDNILHMDDLGYLADSSSVGGYLPELFANSLEGDTPQLLNKEFRGKFVLIDFWGSWCGPCIAALPEMVKFSKEIEGRDDVMIVGIALEGRSDVVKLKGVIKDNGVTWPNYWQENSKLNSPDSPTGKLGIQSFPSYIIVDKSGKIVFSSNDHAFSNENALVFFRNLIN